MWDLARKELMCKFTAPPSAHTPSKAKIVMTLKLSGLLMSDVYK